MVEDVDIDQIDFDSTTDFLQTFAEMKPRVRPRFGKWCVHRIVNNEGRRFDHQAYPHNLAPGGPFDAVDDYNVRTITQQFATRLGKTFTGQCMLLYFADVDPCPMMIATETEPLLKKKILARMYDMIYKSDVLNDKLAFRSTRDHAADLIQFQECRIVGAWARAAGTLADENIKVGLANEIDKEGWDGTSTSVEGSPHKLFDERFKDYQSVRKVVYECTPTIKGRSRVERRRLQSTNCSFFVPCPHCKTYQVLRMGQDAGRREYDWDLPGRLEWDVREDGRHDKEIAMHTARYICISGDCPPIVDHHRAWMMRHGVWAPEGCTVNDERALAAAEHWYDDLTSELGGDSAELDTPWRGWDHADWVEGEPVRNGPDAGYQLSSHYALSLSWGDIAAEYVASRDKPGEFRNFVQGWLGETWEATSVKMDWHQLGGFLIDSEMKRHMVPDFASMLTLGADRQKDHYVYEIDAWGPDRTHHTIEYGEFDKLEFLQELFSTTFRYADGDGGLRIAFGLIDDGYKPDSAVMDFCIRMISQHGFQIWPSKGSNRALDADYRISTLGPNTSKPGMKLIHVDTIRTQMWLDKVLHSLRKGDVGARTLHAGSLDTHQDYLEQMINDGAVLRLDIRNNVEREVWERLNVDIPNDFRDCARYSYAGMLVATRNGPIRSRSAEIVNTDKGGVINAGITRRPDGRSW